MTTARAIRPPHSAYSGLDRAALRVGLALVSWSRRPHRSAPDIERFHHRSEPYRVSAAQERATALLYFRMR